MEKFKLQSKLRLDRVLSVLKKEPAFARYLNGRKVRVRARNGLSYFYPSAVVAATKYLAEKGIDAHSCERSLVLVAGTFAIDPYKSASSH